MSSKWYAGSFGFAAFAGFVGAIRDQYAVVRMIVAPVCAAFSKFSTRSSRHRKDGSSWNPTGILCEATAAAGAAAAQGGSAVG